MPKGANFAPAPSPPVILAAQSNYVSRIFVFRFAVLNLLSVLEEKKQCQNKKKSNISPENTNNNNKKHKNNMKNNKIM